MPEKEILAGADFGEMQFILMPYETPVTKAQFVDNVDRVRFVVKGRMAGVPSREDLDAVLSLATNDYSALLRAQVENTDVFVVTIGSQCGLLHVSPSGLTLLG